MHTPRKILLVLVLLTSSSVYAFDFSKADQLFDHREENLGNIKEAKAIYRRALTQSSIDEMIHATERLGKLAYYEGELLTKENDHSTRRDVFGECQNDVEKISPQKIGKELPAYYYWKATCLALWAKSARPWSVPGRVGELEEAMNHGLSLEEKYEGGGMHRVMGAVYLKSKMLSYIPGLGRFYDPEKALNHIDKAIVFGPEYYNAYITKAEILKELDRGIEGKQLLREKAEELYTRMAQKNLPLGLEAESKVVLNQMKELLKNW